VPIYSIDKREKITEGLYEIKTRTFELADSIYVDGLEYLYDRSAGRYVAPDGTTIKPVDYINMIISSHEEGQYDQNISGNDSPKVDEGEERE